MCYWIVEESKEFDIVEHYGMTGDKKRDIIGYKHKIDDKTDKWYFQCKNYQTASYSDFEKELKSIKCHFDENLDFKPDSIIFITGCVVSSDCKDKTKKFGKSLGLSRVYFWTQIELDQKVKKNKRIFEEFFSGGINVDRTIQKIISGVSSQISGNSNSVISLSHSQKFGEEINNQISDANEFIISRDFEKAKTSLFKILGKLEDNPGNFRSELSRIYNNIGVCFARPENEGGDLDKADFYLNLALTTQPSLKKASVNLVFLYHLKGGKENYQKAFNLAKTLWENSEKGDPLFLHAYVMSVFHYKSAAEAIDVYNKCDESKALANNNIELFRILGYVHFCNNQFDTADMFINSALELSPKHAEALSLKAKILLSRTFKEKVSYKKFRFLPVVTDIQDIIQAHTLLKSALIEASHQRKIWLETEIKLDLLICTLYIKNDLAVEYSNIRNTILQNTLNEHEIANIEFLDIIFEFERRNFPNAYGNLIHSKYWNSLEYSGKKLFSYIFYLRGSPEYSKEILNLILPIAEEQKDTHFWLDLSTVEALLNHKNLAIQSLNKAKEVSKNTKMEKEVLQHNLRILKRYASSGDPHRWIKGMLEYHDQYPEDKSVTKYQEKSAKNPKKLISYLKKQQKSWEDQKERIKSNFCPSYWLEEFLFEPYAKLLSEPKDIELTIPLITPDINFKNELIQNFNDSKVIVFDYASLLNFSKMNLLADLEKYNKQMLICTDLFNKIQEELVVYENQDLRNLWEFIRFSNKFSIIDCDQTYILSIDLSKNFEPWLVNSVIIAKQKNTVLLVDDLHLIKLLKSERVPLCNSIVIIKNMLDNNFIDDEIYSLSLGILAERLYTVIEYSGDDLYKIAISDKGKLTFRTYHLVNQIRMPLLKKSPISWQLLVFVEKIWKCGIIFEDKLNWIKIISKICLESLKDPIKMENGNLECILVKQDLTNMWLLALQNSSKDESKILESEYQSIFPRSSTLPVNG
jgi:hypothetical protein